MVLGKEISRAKESNGLNYLGGTSNNKGHMILYAINSVSMSQKRIMLWHSRLGHPIFDYMRILLPNSMNISTLFQCDTCKFSKQTCSTYLSVPYTLTRLLNDSGGKLDYDLSNVFS